MLPDSTSFASLSALQNQHFTLVCSTSSALGTAKMNLQRGLAFSIRAVLLLLCSAATSWPQSTTLETSVASKVGSGEYTAKCYLSARLTNPQALHRRRHNLLANLHSRLHLPPRRPRNLHSLLSNKRRNCLRPKTYATRRTSRTSTLYPLQDLENF